MIRLSGLMRMVHLLRSGQFGLVYREFLVHEVLSCFRGRKHSKRHWYCEFNSDIHTQFIIYHNLRKAPNL